MYIRLNKKSLLATALIMFSFMEYASATGPGSDSTEVKAPLVKFGLVRKTQLAPENSGSITSSPVPKSLMQNFLSGLTVGGYYRGLFLSRKMTHPYGTFGVNKVMSVGEGQYDPMILMYVGGNPTPATSFGTELIVLNPFTAYPGPGLGFGEVTPYFNMVLRGGINTKHANFFIMAGGIEWLRLTPFTFGTNTAFNRYSVFERRPWDPVGNIKNRYASYYYSGTINQDARFGTRGFKGFIINTFIPKINTNVDVFYGKTQNTAGILREDIVRPSGNLGIRVKKNLKNNNYISLNTFNNYIKLDSINAINSLEWNIGTTEFSYNYKGVTLAGEIGMGRHLDRRAYAADSMPYKNGDLSEGIIVDLTFPKKLTKIPFSLRYFQIGYNFTSNVANFSNTSVRAVNDGGGAATGSSTTFIPFGGGLDNVGDLANNRRGGALNTEIKFWKMILSLGTQVSSDIEKVPQGTSLNVGHRINGIVWGRLPGFFDGGPLAFGPYGRANLVYRGVYETFKLTDTLLTGGPKFKRHYNSLDVQLKFKEKILNRDFFFFYLGSFNSVQNEFSPITKFNDDAYVRGQFHEAEFYYQLTKDFIFSLYTGYENIKGNQNTDLSPTSGKPRDQVGQALGVGCDVALSNQTTLFFRQRWFSYEDKNLDNEKFNGHEATIELKIFF